MQYEMIFTILNRGFSDLVMDAARANGATGGTILTARGTAAKPMENAFGFTVSQEKEIILILSTKEKKNGIMTAICKSAGLTTQGKGITFSLPVDEVLGVSLGINEKQIEALAAEMSETVAEAQKTDTETPDTPKESVEETPSEAPGDGTPQ